MIVIIAKFDIMIPQTSLLDQWRTYGGYMVTCFNWHMEDDQQHIYIYMITLPLCMETEWTFIEVYMGLFFEHMIDINCALHTYNIDVNTLYVHMIQIYVYIWHMIGDINHFYSWSDPPRPKAPTWTRLANEAGDVNGRTDVAGKSAAWTESTLVSHLNIYI